MNTEDNSPWTHEQVIQWRDESLLNALRDLGLPAQRQSESIVTGFEHLLIRPASVMIFTSDDGTLGGCNFGIDVAVQDPPGNQARITQAVGDYGNEATRTVPKALTDLTKKWVNGTIPPLCRLFGSENGQIAGRLNMQSYTEGDAELTIWEGFVGEVQFWGDEALKQLVNDSTPYKLVHETIVNYQSIKKLHWIDVYGIRYSSGKASINIEIDNHSDPQACAIATQQFDWTPVSKECAFRQFIVIRPCGSQPLSEASAELANFMQANDVDVTPREQRQAATQKPDAAKRPKFRFPFGRRR